MEENKEEDCSYRVYCQKADLKNNKNATNFRRSYLQEEHIDKSSFIESLQKQVYKKKFSQTETGGLNDYYEKIT